MRLEPTTVRSRVTPSIKPGRCPRSFSFGNHLRRIRKITKKKKNYKNSSLERSCTSTWNHVWTSCPGYFASFYPYPHSGSFFFASNWWLHIYWAVGSVENTVRRGGDTAHGLPSRNAESLQSNPGQISCFQTEWILGVTGEHVLPRTPHFIHLFI